ncbi:hypothetical protein L596_021961 [Steinernema carpocapsae]|uniref:Uncharacterized protein n=1 Tax=Steinernema carpocapsae TaxID=34508 RepID=A0A4U5MKA8_STECR|nr:hypothetical protein L596_021961 [Steinernema carpocapsae]
MENNYVQFTEGPFETDEGLDELLGFEESLEMTHLPGTGDDQDGDLRDGPPQDAGVGALGGLTEALFAVALIVLFLGYLLDLVEELAHAELQLVQLVLSGNLE